MTITPPRPQQPTFEGALIGFGDRTEEETKEVLREITKILMEETPGFQMKLPL